MKEYLIGYIELRLESLKKDRKDFINHEVFYNRCCGEISAYEDILKKLKSFV